MKYSKQRELIRDYVVSVNTHPTAEEVYKELRKEKKNISLGTVYRNLDVLSKQGLLKRLCLANTKDRFDGNTLYHYHAICTNCGEFTDVNINYFSFIDKEVCEKLDVKVLSHSIIFNTICPKCRNI
ncbi:MAG: transcriptional repressor [Clostridia bacterium]